MNGVISILSHQLAEAQAEGDLPRQVALAVALLKERVSDHGRIQTIIADCCAVLGRQNDPIDLSAALSWYQTWHRHCRAPEAKAGVEALQERIVRLGDAERLLRDATTARDAAALRTALAFFLTNPDRLPTTGLLITEGHAVLESLVQAARRTWSERITRSRVLREDIAKAVPHSLDLAMSAWLELMALDPTVADDSSFADLQERAEAARNRHRLLDSAYAAKALRPLEEAYQAVLASNDRLSTSTVLLDRAQEAQSERRIRLEQLNGELAAIDRRFLDVSLPLLEELAAIDPDGPASAGLQRDRQQFQQLQAWHAIIAAEGGRPLPEIEAAVDGLAAAPAQLGDTVSVVARGRALVSQKRAQIASNARRLRWAVGSAAVVVATVIFLIARDIRGYAAIGEAANAELALAAALAYRDGFHFSNHDAAAAAVTRLQDDVMVQRLIALEAIADPVARMRELDRMLSGDVPTRRDELTNLRERTQLELADLAFAKAKSISDFAHRMTELEAYAAKVGDPLRAKAARDFITRERREHDASVWAMVEAGTTAEQRLAAISAYLKLPNPRRADEANRLRTTLIAEQERELLRSEDEVAWAKAAEIDELLAGIAAVEAYLARPAPAHADEARSRLAKLQMQRDEQAWTQAQTTGSIEERLQRMCAYRAGPAPRSHDVEADTTIAALVWEQAKSPSDPQQRLASVRSYLENPANTAFRTQAQEEIDNLLALFDRELFEQARMVHDPVARITALQDYLQTSGAAQQQAALEEIVRTARTLIESKPALVVVQPRTVLDRIPAGDLVRLPAAYFDRLPASLRARLPQTPAWATSVGVDDYGCWAVLSVGQQAIRVRYVVEGQCQVMTGNGIEAVVNPRPYWMAETECTQAFWSEMLGNFFSDGNPSPHRGPDLPVHGISWLDCRRFIAACNASLAKNGTPAQVGLPTAAQWRFAANTGADGLLALERGSARAYDSRELVRLAYAQESGRQPASVSGTRRDRWGLVDLLGNVGEWCADEISGSAHWRGGAYSIPRAECLPERVTLAKPDEKIRAVGLRLVVVLAASAP